MGFGGYLSSFASFAFIIIININNDHSKTIIHPRLILSAPSTPIIVHRNRNHHHQSSSFKHFLFLGYLCGRSRSFLSWVSSIIAWLQNTSLFLPTYYRIRHCHRYHHYHHHLLFLYPSLPIAILPLLAIPLSVI